MVAPPRLALCGRPCRLALGGRLHHAVRVQLRDGLGVQPQFIALNSIAHGAAMVTENLFEARFRFVNEMVRLGADVRTDGHHAMVRGRVAGPGLGCDPDVNTAAGRSPR